MLFEKLNLLSDAFGVVQMGLPPFIMTLATMYALRGIGLLITNGATISITNDTFTGFSRATFGGFPWTDGTWFEIPVLFWMVILVAVPAYILLNQSRWGRYLFAIGSNAEAARLSGVNVKAVTYLAYIICSTCAAFVGILLAMRIGIGNPTQAEGWELQAIASSVIGGTSLFGAVGSIHGPLIGSFILTTINNGANLLNLNPFWQRIITGALDHRRRLFRQHPAPQALRTAPCGTRSAATIRSRSAVMPTRELRQRPEIMRSPPKFSNRRWNWRQIGRRPGLPWSSA